MCEANDSETKSLEKYSMESSLIHAINKTRESILTEFQLGWKFIIFQRRAVSSLCSKLAMLHHLYKHIQSESVRLKNTDVFGLIIKSRIYTSA